MSRRGQAGFKDGVTACINIRRRRAGLDRADHVTEERARAIPSPVCSSSFPRDMSGLDASRPWLMFWTVHSWDLLGVRSTSENKDRSVVSKHERAPWLTVVRAVSTMMHILHPTGGFCGVTGKHPASTLAPDVTPAVSSLAIRWRTRAEGGWSALAMPGRVSTTFSCGVKRSDGGYRRVSRRRR